MGDINVYTGPMKCGKTQKILDEAQRQEIAGKNIKEKIHVNVDILGYREKRKVVLENLAIRIANGVVINRKPVTLEPMIAYERKIIHTKLQDHKKVKTESIGEGTHRRVVISLK